MTDSLRQHLASLADAEPDAALFARVAAARRRQLQRQRGLQVAGLSACALWVVGTGFWSMRNPPSPVAPATDVAGVDAASGPASPHPDSTPAASLQRIDRELQLAYARNADDSELAALWTARRDIAHSASNAAQPLGI